jgi:hypothetical protein
MQAIMIALPTRIHRFALRGTEVDFAWQWLCMHMLR